MLANLQQLPEGVAAVGAPSARGDTKAKQGLAQQQRRPPPHALVPGAVADVAEALERKTCYAATPPGLLGRRHRRPEPARRRQAAPCRPPPWRLCRNRQAARSPDTAVLADAQVAAAATGAEHLVANPTSGT